MAEDNTTLDEWQRAEISAGLAEAEKGEFASEAEIKRVFDKYKKVDGAAASPSPRILRGEGVTK